MTVPATTRTIVSASAALTVATMPVFLIGALSGQVGEDLGLGEAAVGGAATVLLGTAGLVAAAAGRVTERIGAPIALRLGILIAGAATATVGLFATSWWHIAVPFACVGFAVGLIDTGAARTFADHVQLRWQGTAFGVKEASVPAGSLLAGLALPTVAQAFGWRATFVAAVGIAVVVLLALPRLGAAAATPATSRRGAPMVTAGGAPEASNNDAAFAVSSATLVRFAVAAGLGAGSVTAGATFLVPSASAAGLSASGAGAVLSAGSVASILVRLGTGRLADLPRARPASLATAMMLIGGVGAVLLAVPGGAAVATVTGAMLALGFGWGWTGLAFLTAVRARPTAPAAAAGVVLTGLGIGGAAGPLAFGALVEAASYDAAWAAVAVALAVAGGLAATTTRALAPRVVSDPG